MRRMPVLVIILIVIASMIAVALGMVSTAHAAVGYRFLPEGVTRLQMIDMAKLSFQHDATGNYPLMPLRCLEELDRDACATPYDYYVVYKEKDPNPILTDDVQSMLPFLQSLKDGPAPNDGEYMMSCLVPTTTPGKYKPLVECDHRSFNKGEMVSYDPLTNKIVMAWHCKNPVVGKWEVIVIVPPCAYITVGTHSGNILRYGALIPPGTTLDDAKFCMAVKFPGEKDFHTWVDTCPNQRCNYKQYESITQLSVAAFGSGRSTGGDVVIRVPAYFAKAGERSFVMLCMTEADGRKSCGDGIMAQNYRPYRDDPSPDNAPVMHAYITYKGEDVAHHPGVNWVWDSAETPCPTYADY